MDRITLAIRLNAYSFHLISVYMSLVMSFSSVTCERYQKRYMFAYLLAMLSGLFLPVHQRSILMHTTSSSTSIFATSTCPGSHTLRLLPPTETIFLLCLGCWRSQIPQNRCLFYLWYKSDVEINLTTGVFRSATGMGLLSSLLTNVAYFCDKTMCKNSIRTGEP